ncbi:MAG: hypothetical protein IT373_04680 [Polyangiaceae bacterium]|nr:hypothetical protein [Polyangiaceae bacterium]
MARWCVLFLALVVCGCTSSSIDFAGGGASATTSSGGGGGLGGSAGQPGGAGGAAGGGVAAGGTGGSEAGAGGVGGAGAACGNGSIDPGEECDGTNFGAQSCASYGYADPVGLTCVACHVETAGCHAVCGNTVVEPGETCDDGNANPSDGCDACTIACAGTAVSLSPGLYFDSQSTVGAALHWSQQCAGTTTATDRLYRVTPTADGFLSAWIADIGATFDSTIYALGNCGDPASGILCADNPGTNGRETISFPASAGTTYDVVVDSASAATGSYQMVMSLGTGADCSTAVTFPVWQGAPMTALGTTFGKSDGDSAACGGLGGPDVVYFVNVQFAGQLQITLQAGFDGVLYVRNGCPGNPLLGCARNPAGDETLTIPASVGFIADVTVDMAGGTPGPYTLTFTPL